MAVPKYSEVILSQKLESLTSKLFFLKLYIIIFNTPEHSKEDFPLVKNKRVLLGGDKLGLLKGKPIVSIFHKYYFYYRKIRSVKANT